MKYSIQLITIVIAIIIITIIMFIIVITILLISIIKVNFHITVITIDKALMHFLYCQHLCACYPYMYYVQQFNLLIIIPHMSKTVAISLCTGITSCRGIWLHFYNTKVLH